MVKVLGRTIPNQEKLTEDSRSLLNVVVDYTYALDTLDRYDYQELKIDDTTGKEAFHATYENAMEVIHGLHEKFGGSTLFGILYNEDCSKRIADNTLVALTLMIAESRTEKRHNGQSHSQSHQ